MHARIQTNKQTYIHPSTIPILHRTPSMGPDSITCVNVYKILLLLTETENSLT